ncbi:MAG TPA: PD-(D/E)XK nuclease family protein, partial [Bacteroidota bacterium]
RPLPLVSTVEPVKLRETQRGEFIHAVLSDIEFLGADVEKTVAAAIERRKYELRGGFAAENVAKTVLEFLRIPAVAAYFASQKDRTVLNEQEVVDRTGALHRIDRLVVDAGTVTVLDYKTGEENTSYNEQVEEYMEIVRTMYPGKTVRGVLLYVDRKTEREVA